MTKLQEIEKRDVTEPNELQLANKKVLLCYFSLAMVLFLSYLIELVKGNRTVTYILIYDVILLVPLIISMISYKKNKGTIIMKHAMSIGYCLFYDFILLTSTSILSFVYAVPMLIIIMIYHDAKYSLRVGLAMTAVNAVYVIYQVTQGNTTTQHIVNYEIEIALIILVSTYTYISSKVLNQINTSKLHKIQVEKERQDFAVIQIKESANNILEKVESIDEQSKTIKEQSTSTKEAIIEIASGTNDVATNIQAELLMNSTISEKLNRLTDLIVSMQAEFQSTKEIAESGSAKVAELTDSTVKVTESKNTVETSMESLNHEIVEAKGILEMINGITRQTNLLSLNASIEAARVGEQGKGFAVVASEIQKLSEDTESATEKINQILQHLETESSNAANSVIELGTVSNKQNELIEETKASFFKISSDIQEVSKSIEEQSMHIHSINESNIEIEESISNMSAFTEELTANAENCESLSIANLEGTRKVSQWLDEVLLEVKNLQKIM